MQDAVRLAPRERQQLLAEAPSARSTRLLAAVVLLVLSPHACALRGLGVPSLVLSAAVGDRT